MKKLLFAISFLQMVNVIAQPVLTNTSQIGYTAPLALASAASAGSTPIAVAGANVSWNAASLVKDPGIPIINFTVTTPVGTAYAADYPNANWYFTDPALVAIAGHNYYHLATDSFVLWGAHVAGSAYEIYDNPEMDLKFPFAYNDNVVNTYSKTNYTAAGGISSYQTGDVTLTYDGYGSLTLPAGTYNNVIRIKKVRTNNLGPTLTSYTWYHATNGERLLFYEEKAGATINVIFNTNVVSSISDVFSNNQIDIKVDPNSGAMMIQSDKKIEKVTLYSTTGAAIKQIQNVNSNQINFVNEAAKGVYILSVMSEGRVSNSKIVF